MSQYLGQGMLEHTTAQQPVPDSTEVRVVYGNGQMFDGLAQNVTWDGTELCNRVTHYDVIGSSDWCKPMMTSDRFAGCPVDAKVHVQIKLPGEPALSNPRLVGSLDLNELIECEYRVVPALTIPMPVQTHYPAIPMPDPIEWDGETQIVVGHRVMQGTVGLVGKNGVCTIDRDGDLCLYRRKDIEPARSIYQQVVDKHWEGTTNGDVQRRALAKVLEEMSDENILTINPVTL